MTSPILTLRTNPFDPAPLRFTAIDVVVGYIPTSGDGVSASELRAILAEWHIDEGVPSPNAIFRALQRDPRVYSPGLRGGPGTYRRRRLWLRHVPLPTWPELQQADDLRQATERRIEGIKRELAWRDEQRLRATLGLPPAL